MRKHHNKLYYGKYQFKTFFKMPWAGILYPTTDENLQKMLDGTHHDVKHLNKHFWKVDSKVLKLAKFILDNRTRMKFRLQQKYAIFYSDKNLAKVIVDTFWDFWDGSESIDPNYNKLGKDREQLLTRANQIQGALTVLNELDGDLPTEATPS